MTSNLSKEMLKASVRPEFLNRIDDIITFGNLTKQEIREVVELQLNRVKKMLEPQGVVLKVTDDALNLLADVGYDPEFGARPVKRAIQTYLLNDLSRQLLSGTVNIANPIIVNVKDGVMEFTNN